MSDHLRMCGAAGLGGPCNAPATHVMFTGEDLPGGRIAGMATEVCAMHTRICTDDPRDYGRPQYAPTCESPFLPHADLYTATAEDAQDALCDEANAFRAAPDA